MHIVKLYVLVLPLIQKELLLSLHLFLELIESSRSSILQEISSVSGLILSVTLTSAEIVETSSTARLFVYRCFLYDESFDM